MLQDRGDAGDEHRGVLAGAVHPDPVALSAGADQPVPGRFVLRPVHRAAERVLGQAGAGQHRPNHLDVPVVAGVAAGGDRQRRAGQLVARRDPAGQRLHRLEGGAGQHRLVGYAGGEGDRAVRGEHHDAAVVPALDEAVAHDPASSA